MPAISKPGVYQLPAKVYHGDPCPTPSLSSGAVRRLLGRSPLHAHYNHPRLGGGHDEAPTRAMNDGSVVHMLMLGQGAELVEIDAEDYRTKLAKETRDDALAAGKMPVLKGRLLELQDIAEMALEQMRAHPGCREFFDDGLSEAVMAWQEGDVWCRSMVDRLPTKRTSPMFDIKTTALSANPQEYDRKLATDYALTAAWYSRGGNALHGVTGREYRFVVIEMEAPHAISVMACADDLLAVREPEVERAIATWRQCLATGKWPSYPPQVAYAHAPRWLLAQAEQTETLEAEILAMEAA